MFFFFNDTATTEIYTLSLHDALPILCIQVFVSKKIPQNQLNSNDMIPLIYKGIPTDVKETGQFKACYLIERKRPVLGGYSISTNMNNEVSGTAGCVVTNGVSKFILGTNHVLANSNVLPIKTPIIQPAYRSEEHTSELQSRQYLV